MKCVSGDCAHRHQGLWRVAKVAQRESPSMALDSPPPSAGSFGGIMPIAEAYAFDDVLLVPAYSTVLPA